MFALTVGPYSLASVYNIGIMLRLFVPLHALCFAMKGYLLYSNPLSFRAATVLPGMLGGHSWSIAGLHYSPQSHDLAVSVRVGKRHKPDMQV